MLFETHFAEIVLGAILPSHATPPPKADERPGPIQAPPVSWERYLEATEALTIGLNEGKGHKEILLRLGMTPAGFLDAASHWGAWFARNVALDPSLLETHRTLSSQYRRKYTRPTDDADPPL